MDAMPELRTSTHSLDIGTWSVARWDCECVISLRVGPDTDCEASFPLLSRHTARTVPQIERAEDWTQAGAGEASEREEGAALWWDGQRGESDDDCAPF